MTQLFISLATVKDQCRVAHSDDDDRMDRIRAQAQAITLDYLKVSEDAFAVGSPAMWVLPTHIEAAMLLVADNLYNGELPLSASVTILLERSRDPTMA